MHDGHSGRAVVCNSRSDEDYGTQDIRGTSVAPTPPMFMFDRKQLFVSATLIALIEILTVAIRAAH